MMFTLSYCQENEGYTAAELLVIIAVMGIMTAIALPNLLNYMAKSRLNGAAMTVYSDLMGARMKAVQLNCKVIVNFETAGPSAGKEYFIIFDKNGNNCHDTDETKIVKNLAENYPGVMNIKHDTKNIFNSRGALSRMRNIILKNESGERTIRVSIAGRVKIE